MRQEKRDDFTPRDIEELLILVTQPSISENLSNLNEPRQIISRK